MSQTEEKKPSLEEYCAAYTKIIEWDIKRRGQYIRYTVEEWVETVQAYEKESGNNLPGFLSHFLKFKEK